MSRIYSIHKKLEQQANRSYWEKRILAETRYMIELLYEKENGVRALLDQAMELLEQEYLQCGQLTEQTARKIEEWLLPYQEEAKKNTVICAAHAHMDMNWMWGYQETVTLTLDTVRTMLVLMEEYPQFVFSQSQASVYRILEEYAPELLEQVKRRVQEGRWEVTASAWVENDTNLSGGEAMARQILYTKEYLSKLLEIPKETMNLCFLPDTFGHSANLPETLNQGGVTRMYHCRGYEGDAFVYRFRAMSGAEVLTSRDQGWYNRKIDSNLCQDLPAFLEKYGLNMALRIYGVGDHGGGPTRRDLDRLLDMAQWPLYPVLKLGTYREYYDHLEERMAKLPVVNQELNYVFTGCYTSQSRIKMANRIGETRLTEAETLENMAELLTPDYKGGLGMEEAWRKLLFNQFHDILPGSGIIETREHALGYFQEICARCGANASRAMTAICDSLAEKEKTEEIQEKGNPFVMDDTSMGAGVGHGVDQRNAYLLTRAERGSGKDRYYTFFNVTQTERKDPVELILWDYDGPAEDMVITDLKGREYPYQILDYEVGYFSHVYHKLLVWMPIPPVGYKVCKVSVKEAEHLIPLPVDPNSRIDCITDEPLVLENDKIRSVFDITTMKCISLYDKSCGKEMIDPAKPAGGLQWITEETSQGMASWRVGRSGKTVELNEVCMVRPIAIKTEGLHQEIRYSLEGEGIKAKVTISLNQGSSLLDYQIEADWLLPGTEKNGIPQLRFTVPLKDATANYRYAIPYGMLDREALAQDVPSIGLICSLPENGENGTVLFSDSKYGFRGDKEGMSVNLIRSSYEPDPYPELGSHVIRLAVGVSSSKKEDLALLLDGFMHPVLVRSCLKKPAAENAEKSILSLKGGVLSALKKAEDGEGFVVRVYNPDQEEITVKLQLPGSKKEVYRCNFLEEQLSKEEGKAGEDLYTISSTLKKCEVGSFYIKR